MLEHFAWIAAATNHVGADGASMWDEEDGFFYDVLRRPDGSSIPLKVRSLVGLMPLAAATVLDPAVRSEFPELVKGLTEFLSRHPAVAAAMPGASGSRPAATGPCCSRCSTRPGCAGSWRGCWTRRSSSARTGSVRCRGGTPSTRS